MNKKQAHRKWKKTNPKQYAEFVKAKLERSLKRKLVRIEWEKWKKGATKEELENKVDPQWWRWGTPTFINTWFEGSSAHHMEKQIIIFIPDQLHQSVKHNLVKGTNMLEINGLAMAWFESLLQQTLEVSNGLD